MSRSDQWLELEYFTSAETLVIESTSTVTTTRNIEVLGAYITKKEQDARQFIPTETDHQNLEAASSQQSTSFGATTSTGLRIRKHVQALHEDPTTHRSSWNRSSNMGSCCDKHAKCWTNSELGTKKKWIDALGRSTDNPRRSFVRMTKGNWDSCSTRTQSWCHNQSNFAWKQTPLSWKEHKHHTGLFQLWIILKEGTRQGCFFSLLNSQNASSRQRTIDWTGPAHDCRSKALADHDCISYFNLDELKTQIWYFIKVAVTRLFCTTVCRQAHWTRWSLLQVKFCSKGSHPPFTLAFSSLLPLLSPPSLPTFTKPEATLGVCQVNLKWRILWTNEKQMSFSSPVWWRKSWSIEANQRGLTMWPRIIHRQMQKSITTLSHIEIQKLTLYKTVTWRHCVSVVVCYWALPKMSISMQSNESTRFIMYIPGIHKVALKPPWIP